MNILDGLDEDQKAACIVTDKPVLSLAGPGSGKTRLLTHSIAYRIKNGVKAENIAALTFTHKGAKEIKDRVIALCGHEAKQCDISTYHSFVNRNILMVNKQHPAVQLLGYKKGFIVCSEDDARTSLNIAIQNLPSLHRALVKAYDIKPKQVRAFMSFERANGLLAKEYLSNLKYKQAEALKAFKSVTELVNDLSKDLEADILETKINEIADEHPVARVVVIALAWRQYEEVLVQSNAMDFDGMLVAVQKMLEADPKLCKSLANEYTHILLDEFQDTNPVQFKIFSLIAHAHDNKNLFAVGDIRQILYRFRNTDAGVSEKFAEMFGAEIKTLNKNYRSTENIITLGNAIGETITSSLTNADMEAMKAHHKMPEAWQFSDDIQEAKFIRDYVQSKISEGIKPSDIAILYRTKTIKKEVEAKLVEAQIPHTIVGDRDFYETKEVMDMLALLRTVMYEGDFSSGSRVIDAISCGIRGVTARYDVMAENRENRPLGMIDYLESRIQSGKRLPSDKEKQNRLFNGTRQLRHLKTIASNFSLEEIELRFAKSYKDNELFLADAVWSKDKLLETFREAQTLGFVDANIDEGIRNEFKKTLVHFSEKVMSFYQTFMRPVLEAGAQKQNSETADEVMRVRDSNVETLLETLVTNSLSKSISITESLDELVMLAESEEKYEDDKVQLMTIHASKGLEFKHVVLMGLEEETFFKSEEPSTDDINSESCALFVGLTRAEQELVTTFSRTRFINGQNVSLTGLSLFYENEKAIAAVKHRKENESIANNYKDEQEESLKALFSKYTPG